MPHKTYTFKKLWKVLTDYDARFVCYATRAKGSERMIFHPDINGRSESYPIKCHNEGDDIRVGHIAAIRRRFNLPADLL